jgi:type VI secretion system protein ImpF
MARSDNEVRVTLSVLDRLIDLDPRQSQEPPKSRSTSLSELKQAVRRDLEWLLNTRCYTELEDTGLEEAIRSVANYGLPDFTGLSVRNHNEQKRLSKALEFAIKTFEPRFVDLTVSLEPINSVDRELKFRIAARLNIEPTPEPVAFDTILQLGSGDFTITEL